MPNCVLDKDHFGLTKVKTAFWNTLAVLKLETGQKGPILVLLLLWSPGVDVGKTSLEPVPLPRH